MQILVQPEILLFMDFTPIINPVGIAATQLSLLVLKVTYWLDIHVQCVKRMERGTTTYLHVKKQVSETSFVVLGQGT